MKRLLETLKNYNNQSVSVTVEDVESAVRGLNCSNTLDCEHLCFNHILHSHPATLSCLTLLFNDILTNGVFPRKMGLSVIHPIKTNNIKSTHDSSNYRPISIMPVTAKIFEAFVVKIIDNKLVFHEN